MNDRFAEARRVAINIVVLLVVATLVVVGTVYNTAFLDPTH